MRRATTFFLLILVAGMTPGWGLDLRGKRMSENILDLRISEAVVQPISRVGKADWLDVLDHDRRAALMWQAAVRSFFYAPLAYDEQHTARFER